MTKKETIISFDIATTTGYAVVTNKEIIEHGHFTLKSSKVEFYNKVCDILDRYKADYIIAASPTRFFNTIFKHGRIFGLFDLALEQRGLKFWMDKTAKGRDTLPIDSRIKKDVLGKGKASKQEIMDFIGIQQEDEADAVMFAKYLEIQLSK